MKKKLTNLIADAIILLPILAIIIIGCHLDATYTAPCTVYDIKGTEIYYEDIRTGDVFSEDDADKASTLYIGQTCKIKFDHNGTEGNRKDDIILSVKY